ncbi:MAG: hypothetical protein MJZ57_07100 [Bacteroidales bacterium]|nr:hypothetical protein [Bacteroidales bacterium]
MDENVSVTRDVFGEGNPQLMLKMVEGNECNVSLNFGRKHPLLDSPHGHVQCAFIGMNATVF